MEFTLKGAKTLTDWDVERNEEIKAKLVNGEYTQEEYDSRLNVETSREVIIKDGDKAGTVLISHGYDFVRVSIDDLKRILKTM